MQPVNTYVMYGAIFPLEGCTAANANVIMAHYFDDPHDQAKNLKHDITALVDRDPEHGYIAIGHVLAKTDCGAHFDVRVSIPLMPPEIWKWGEATARLAGQLGYELKNWQPGWHVLSHYR